MDKKIQELLSHNKSQCMYMVELMIISLNFDSENMIDEINDRNSYLSIDLTFLNLPTFTIKEESVKLSKIRRNTLESDDFSTAGVSCLFPIRPSNFSEMMDGKKPLKVAIYKMNINSISPEIDDIDKEPICQTAIHFNTCLCDLFNMTSINNGNLPESFEARESFELFDTIDNQCGTIELFTRISCCGTSIITRFHNEKKSFIFNNINTTNEFVCSRVLSAKGKNSSVVFDGPKAKTIVGVSKLCEDLRIKVHKSPPTSLICITRMRGGGLDDKNINLPIFPLPSMNTLLSGACRTNQDDKPGCGCHGKTGIGLMKMEHGCSSKPCHGIDCLIRAFKDTQEFVDNIKVTGMSGLGLMDPMESPYFGRNRYSALPTTCMDQKKPTENISNNPKDINTLFDNSNRRNIMPLIPMKLKHDEKLLHKNLELIEQQDKNTGNGQRDENLFHSKKTNHKNGAIDYKEPPRNSIQPKPQLHSNNETEATRTSRISRKTRVTKRYSELHRIYSSKNGIKPSKAVMKLVRSVANRLHFGHRSCVDIRMRVPGNMGWLWNTKNTAGEPKAQIGWKPGAISRQVWRLLEEAKGGKTDEIPVERPITPTKGKKSKTSRKRSPFLLPRSLGARRKGQEDEYDLPPVLHVHRKAGAYYITFYPVKKDFIHHPELQEKVSPYHFKVIKNKEDAESNATSSIAPDMEFEFSPPIAHTRYNIKIITNDASSQVREHEIVDSINDSNQLMRPKRKLQKIRRFDQI